MSHPTHEDGSPKEKEKHSVFHSLSRKLNGKKARESKEGVDHHPSSLSSEPQTPQQGRPSMSSPHSNRLSQISVRSKSSRLSGGSLAKRGSPAVRDSLTPTPSSRPGASLSGERTSAHRSGAQGNTIDSNGENLSGAPSASSTASPGLPPPPFPGAAIDHSNPAHGSESLSRTASFSTKAGSPAPEESEGPASGQDEDASLASISLNEAVIDSPSFRSSSDFVDTQFNELETWLIAFVSKLETISAQLDKLKDSVNGVLGHFMPSFTHHSILAHDYTTLLFGQYTRAESGFWTDVITRSKQNAEDVKVAVQGLRNGSIARYRTARDAYIMARREQDAAFSALMRIPVDAEPAAVRDATQLYLRKKWTNMKISTALSLQIAELESEASTLLLEKLSRQFGTSANTLLGLSANHMAQVVDFHRLHAVALKLQESAPGLTQTLKRLRATLLQESKPASPPKDLEYYRNAEAVTVPEADHGEHPRKMGWVYAYVEGEGWTMLWAFVMNGYLGFLSRAKDGKSVLESRKYALAHYHAEAASQSEGRRWVFTVSPSSTSTSGSVLRIQAVGREDLGKWISIINSASQVARTAESELGKQGDILPWSPSQSFNVDGNNEVQHGFNAVAHRVKLVEGDVDSTKWLHFDSTLSYEGASAPAITVPSVKPMPSNAVFESLIASWYFRPHGFSSSMTANFWGVNNWLSATPEPEISDSFPTYPDSFPRGVIVQDMDMRALTQRLPRGERPDLDDMLLFIVRATTKMRGNEVPTRLYVTRKHVVVYSAWRGLVALRSLPIHKLVDVETKHGVDFSELKLVMRSSSSEADGVYTIPFRLYIDASALVKRRLMFLLENLQSRDPQDSRSILESSVLMGMEYADAIKSDSTRKMAELTRATSTKKSDNTLPSNGLAGLLLQRSIVGSSGRGEEDVMQFGKGMQAKLNENTFPISAKALFLTIFGSRSPVFSGESSDMIAMSSKVGPWYRRAKRLERKLEQTIQNSANSEKVDKRYNYQRLDRTDRDIYVVTERRASWELPSGARFYFVFKYVIYSTEQGCHFQIWAKTVWTRHSSSVVGDEAVREFSKLTSRSLMLRIRDAASLVHSSEEARSKYGSVRATQVAPGKENYEELENVTRVSTRSLVNAVTRTPFMLSIQAVRWIIVQFLAWIFKLSSTLLVLLALGLLSLLLNFALWRRSKAAYWEVRLAHEETDSLVKSLGMLPSPDMVLKRAIYTAEVNDAISAHSLFPSLQIKYQNDTLDAVSASPPLRPSCGSRFAEVASLSSWASEYGSVYEHEPRIQDTLERIAAVRQGYALRRNTLLTELRLLNSNEILQLEQEYRYWLIGETEMCSRVRPQIQMLNATVFGEIRDYCISCLEEAKDLI